MTDLLDDVAAVEAFQDRANEAIASGKFGPTNRYFAPWHRKPGPYAYVHVFTDAEMMAIDWASAVIDTDPRFLALGDKTRCVALFLQQALFSQARAAGARTADVAEGHVMYLNTAPARARMGFLVHSTSRSLVEDFRRATNPMTALSPTSLFEAAAEIVAKFPGCRRDQMKVAA